MYNYKLHYYYDVVYYVIKLHYYYVIIHCSSLGQKSSTSVEFCSGDPEKYE